MLAALEDAPVSVPPAAAALVALLFLGLGVGLLRSFGPRLLARRGWRPDQPPWGMRELFGALLLFLASLTLVQAAVLRYASLTGREFDDLGALEHLVTGFAWQFVTAIPAFVIFARSGLGRRALGFQRGDNLAWTVRGVLLYLCALPALYGVLAAWQVLNEVLGHGLPPQAISELVSEAHAAHLVPVTLFAVVLIPCLEELIFRGFLQPYFVARMDPARGVLLTSVLFAILHGFTAAPPIFFLALVLGTVRERSGRLLPAIFLHVLHNGGNLLLLEFAKDAAGV